jgi:hypothetical protein
VGSTLQGCASTGKPARPQNGPLVDVDPPEPSGNCGRGGTFAESYRVE